ncbi:hypothetical protein HDU78_009809 [Chytriomyces hyalinus]|nr:hypothetical protein HDU78_009809 [Chytriomyces hyalinus]
MSATGLEQPTPAHARVDSGVAALGSSPFTFRVRRKGDENSESEVTIDDPTYSALKNEIRNEYELPSDDFVIFIGLRKQDFRMSEFSPSPKSKIKNVLKRTPASDILFEFTAKYRFKAVAGESSVIVTVGELKVDTLKEQIRSNFSELSEFSLQYKSGGNTFILNETDKDIGNNDLADYYSAQDVQSPAVVYVHIPSPAVQPAKEAEAVEPVPSVTESSAPVIIKDVLPQSRFDSMMSYAWATQTQVIELKASLEKELGINVWMDVHNMKDNIYAGMWEGITKSDLIIVCLSKEYLNSANCKLELTYAADLQKPLVCVYMFEEGEDLSSFRLDPKYGPLLFLVSGKLYIDFKRTMPSSSLWQARFPQLVGQVQSLLPVVNSKKARTYDDSLAHALEPEDFGQQMSKYESDYVNGTRQWIAGPLDLWLTTGEWLVWVNGAAGTGKSVIAWLVAENKESRFGNYTTGSVFFCRHNNELLRDPARIIRTMIWDLCSKYKSVKTVVEKALAEDKENVAAGLASILKRPIEAFKHLVVKGLRTLPADHKPVLLIIDALDECSPQTRGQLLTILTKTSELPAFVKFFVTGRPEEDIYESLNPINPFELCPTAFENLQDLKIFARTGLAQILEVEGPALETELFTKSVETFVTKSEGVFIWGKCVLDHLRDRRMINGAITEETLLEAIESFESGTDNMYKLLLNRASKESSDLSEFRRTLSIVLAVKEPVSFAVLASLGGQSVSDTGISVAKLRSILKLEESAVAVIHKSLKDFLVDAARSGPQLHVSLPDCDMQITMRCFDILCSQLARNMASLDPSVQYAPAGRIPVSDELAYATRFWASHFQGASHPEELVDKLFEFCETKFANWIEAMMLLNKRSDIIRIATDLDSVLANLKSEAVDKIAVVRTLLNDARLIAVNFLIPLQFNPLQVYTTVGVWAKKNSEFFKRFHDPSGFKFVAPVKSTAISHNGRLVASGSLDATIKLWSLDGACLATLEGHSDGVSSVAFTKDDKTIVSGSLDGSVKVWRTLDGFLIREVTHGSKVNAIAVSATHAVSAASDGSIKIWKLMNWECEHSFKVESEVHAVALSWNGSIMAYGLKNGDIKVWDMKSLCSLNKGFKDSSAVLSLSFSRTQNWIASASESGAVKMWSLETEQCLKTFSAGDDAAFGVAVTANSEHVVSTDAHGRVNVFDVADGTCKTYHFQSYPNYTVAVSANASLKSEAIAVGGKAGVVDLYSWRTPVPCNSREDGILSNNVEGVMFADDNREIYVLEEGTGAVEVWNLSDGRRTTEQSAPRSNEIFNSEPQQGSFRLTDDSWVVNKHGTKLMWVPIFANGACISKDNVVVLTKGSRLYVLRR